MDTLPKLLLRNVAQRGDRPAIREKSRGIWRTTSWRDLADEALALAAALAARGLRRGDPVAFLGDNRPRLYAGIAAAQRLGAVAVPLFQDATAAELAGPIARAGVVCAFAENQEQVDKLLEILPRCPSLRSIVYDEDRGMRHYRQSGIVSYAALLDEGRAALPSSLAALESECGRGEGGDPAVLFFTAGASGPSKGVILTHAALIDRARAAAKADGLTDADVTMAYLPAAWIGQHMFAYVLPMTTGCCVCCPESSETIFADMREIGPSLFLGTPRVYEALFTQLNTRLESGGGLSERVFRRALKVAGRVGAGASSFGDRLSYAVGDLMMYGPLRDVLGMSRIRSAYTAGDAIDLELLRFFRSIGVNLKQLYGSTETGFFVAMQRDGSAAADDVGTPVDGAEVRIGGDREIVVRSAGLFQRYLEEDASSPSRDADGWFRTGDAGELGADGRLSFIDRLSDLGRLEGGTVFSPKLIEGRLKLIPTVRQAVVFSNARDAVCALIDLDATAIARWADRMGIAYTGHADLASLDETYRLIADSLGEVNASFARDDTLARCQVRRFAILRRPLSADEGDLTRTGKLKRGALAERHRALIDAMFAERVDAPPPGDAAAKIGEAAAPASNEKRAA